MSQMELNVSSNASSHSFFIFSIIFFDICNVTLFFKSIKVCGMCGTSLSNLLNLIINYSLSPPPSFSLSLSLSFPLSVSLSFSLCLSISLSISFSFFLYLSVTACQVAHQHRYLQVSLPGSPLLCQPRLCII